MRYKAEVENVRKSRLGLIVDLRIWKRYSILEKILSLLNRSERSDSYAFMRMVVPEASFLRPDQEQWRPGLPGKSMPRPYDGD